MSRLDAAKDLLDEALSWPDAGPSESRWLDWLSRAHKAVDIDGDSDHHELLWRLVNVECLDGLSSGQWESFLREAQQLQRAGEPGRQSPTDDLHTTPETTSSAQASQAAGAGVSHDALSRVRAILGYCAGGVHKRIDENRELLELLQREAPTLLASHPWVEGWLKSHDDFFVALEEGVPITKGRFLGQAKHRPARFPRPWPGCARQQAAPAGRSRDVDVDVSGVGQEA